MAVRDPFSNITSDGFCEKHFHEKNNNPRKIGKIIVSNDQSTVLQNNQTYYRK